MNTVFRCKKCRLALFQKDSLVTCHNENIVNNKETSELGNSCLSQTSNILFIDEQKVVDWIRNEINNQEWTKGRLTCPGKGCGARVGSFNFVNGANCACNQLVLPPVQIIRSKVDEPLNLH